MVDLDVAADVGGLLLTVRAGLLHHAHTEVHLGHVQPQVIVGVGGVGALVTRLVTNPRVNLLQVFLDNVLAEESLVALITRVPFGLKVWLATSCPL